MEKTCSKCRQNMTIDDADLAFYKKVSPVIAGKTYEIPPPTLCPDCRRQRRRTWRNERKLYHNKCALSGKQMISMYSPDKPYTVYEQREWWSDKWNGLDFGKAFDFKRTFFEQFDELQKSVPRINLCNDSVSTNCDFVNQTTHLKNCYLVFDTDTCEDLYYCHLGKYSRSSIDCLRLFRCERCYECVDCHNCYGLLWSQDCENCSDSVMLLDCIGCTDCIGCAGLRNAKNCVFNKQCTLEEYQQKYAKFHQGSFADMQATRQFAIAEHLKHPRKEHHNVLSEDGVGDYLRNAKNATHCYDCIDIRDCRYCWNLANNAKDCCDYDVWAENSELIYECITVGENAHTVLFSESCWADIHDLMYCTFCMHSSHLFGCTGLKGNQYCILNKQYTKEEYETIVPKIIEHMRKTPLRSSNGSYEGQTGEWGEFFPASISAFGYNESVAHDFFPLSQENVQNKGWKWHDNPDDKKQYLGPSFNIPDTVTDVTDDVCKNILTCSVTGKPYKIIPQELAFYREMNIPLPRKCPEQRHVDRRALRNPPKLWKRTCSKCSKELRTTYSPERPEIVYCDTCYFQTVY